MFKISKPDYAALIDGKVKLPSVVMGLMDRELGEPPSSALLNRLADGPLATEHLSLRETSSIPNARFEITGAVTGAEDQSLPLFRVWVEECADLEDLHLQWRGISGDEKERAKKAEWMIGVETEFGDEPLRDYHLQLQLLQVLAPELVMVFDVMSCRPFSGEWLRDTARSSVPPAPEFLFSVHAVYDEKTGKNCWLHTHGLKRCGSIELEILDTDFDQSEHMGRLLNSVAAMFIDGGVPEEDLVFSAGTGIDLVWLPWDKGLSKVPGNILGARPDRDENHDHPSGILFAKTGLIFKKYRSPAVYLPKLSDNPVLFVSNMETERMRLLARERFQEFGELFSKTGSNDEQWMFIVKLGYQVDDAESETDREHLWFQVHELGSETVDATLLNEPYNIERMHEGQRDRHPIDLLTDWSVMNRELGSFGPDTIYHLKRQL